MLDRIDSIEKRVRKIIKIGLLIISFPFVILFVIFLYPMFMIGAKENESFIDILRYLFNF